MTLKRFLLLVLANGLLAIPAFAMQNTTDKQVDGFINTYFKELKHRYKQGRDVLSYSFIASAELEADRNAILLLVKLYEVSKEKYRIAKALRANACPEPLNHLAKVIIKSDLDYVRCPEIKPKSEADREEHVKHKLENFMWCMAQLNARNMPDYRAYYQDNKEFDIQQLMSNKEEFKKFKRCTALTSLVGDVFGNNSAASWLKNTENVPQQTPMVTPPAV